MDRQTHTDGQTNRRTDQQTDRQTDVQTDKQAGRKTCARRRIGLPWAYLGGSVADQAFS